MLPSIDSHTITVDPITGGMRIEVVDLVIPCLGPDMVFARVHDSLRNLDHNHGCLFPFDDRLLFDADGAVRHIHASGNETRFVPAGGGSYSPSTSFNLEALTAETGGTWRITYLDGSLQRYRADGRLLEVRDPYGNALSYTWWGSGEGALVETITDTTGRQVTMASVPAGDGSGSWVFTDWSGRTWSYHWTGLNSGYVKAYTDPEGNVTTYGSPENGGGAFSGISSITLPDGTLALQVQPVGGSPLSTKVAQLTFANGLVATYTYSWATRTTTIDIGGQITVVEYDANLDVVRTTDPLGNLWQQTYDASHNLLQSIDPRLAVQTYTYWTRSVRTDPPGQ